MLNKIRIKRISGFAFLTIGIWLVCDVLLGMFDNNWKDFFSAIGNIGSVIIGAGMFYLGWQQHKHLQQKISEEDKAIIREHYHKCDNLFRKIRVAALEKDKSENDFNDYATQLIDLADSAAVELPKSFEEKMNELFNFFEQAKN